MRVIESRAARTFIRAAVPVLLTASAVLFALFGSDGRKYAVLTVIVTLLALLLFAAGFDSRRIGSRRLVLGAVFITLASAGRFIPQLKPMTAVVIISGIYTGGETGFLVGALSVLLSNFFFGNGPWTPVQMVAMGLIGLFAGLCSPPLKKSRAALCVYGAAAGVFYSMFMDIWTTCSATGSLMPSAYFASVLAALPFTVIYAVSNVLYLLLLAPPLGRKLQRVSEKYGL
ncbi:MAG: ECF transporter S component [Clostridia bacterium]|nr:ECF transporter S component [Clostridia bacterium]